VYYLRNKLTILLTPIIPVEDTMKKKAILSILLLGSVVGSTVNVNAGIFDEPSAFETLTEGVRDFGGTFVKNFPAVFATTFVSAAAYFLSRRIIENTWTHCIVTPYYKTKYNLYLWYYTIQANRIINDKEYFQKKYEREGAQTTLSIAENIAIGKLYDNMKAKDPKLRPSKEEVTAINLCIQAAQGLNLENMFEKKSG